jgi:hypothetical protein
MSAGYQELFIEQGTDYNTTITLDDVDGNPFNLTGYTGKSQVRKSYYSTNATAQFVISIPTPNNGGISLSLSSANTANISAGRYVYDVMIKDSSNNVTRVLEGIVNILPRVTVF